MEHRLFEICDHYLISFSLDDFSMVFSEDLLKEEIITEESLHYLKRAEFNYNIMKKYIIDKTDPVDGFLYFDKELNQPVGCIRVMYQGGNEVQYRIRKIDAFGFYFDVFPEFRGNRYIEFFIYSMLKHLEAKGITKLYASVRKNNIAALKAYKHAGMKIEAEKKFYRFIKWRIPYPIV